MKLLFDLLTSALVMMGMLVSAIAVLVILGYCILAARYFYEVFS